MQLAPDIVRELADRQAITDLIHGYCFHFDNNEPESVAALFTDDATVDYGPESATIVGSEAIAATIAVGLERTFAATSHHVSNIQITFDGPDHARRDHVRLRLAPLRRRLARRRVLGPIPPRFHPYRGGVAHQPTPAPGGRDGRLPPSDDAPDRPPLSPRGVPPTRRRQPGVRWGPRTGGAAACVSRSMAVVAWRRRGRRVFADGVVVPAAGVDGEVGCGDDVAVFVVDGCGDGAEAVFEFLVDECPALAADAHEFGAELVGGVDGAWGDAWVVRSWRGSGRASRRLGLRGGRVRGRLRRRGRGCRC